MKKFAVCCMIAFFGFVIMQSVAVFASVTSYDRSVDKECLGPTGLKLAPGQSYRYPFRWTLGAVVENIGGGDPWELEDECVTVTDNCTTPVTACYNGSEYAYVQYAGDDHILYITIPGGGVPVNNYTCPIRYSSYGMYSYINTATTQEHDTHDTVSDTCNVSVHIPINICTLTPGYWKTHSELGPAPYDDARAGLPNGASTLFFLSNKTYHDVLVSKQAGIYWDLANQYAATKLNQLNGTILPPNVLGAFNAATNLLQNNTPIQMNAWVGIRRFLVVTLTAILRNYNMGLVGPGSCDEDSSSAQNVLTEDSDIALEKTSGEALIPFVASVDMLR